MAVDMPTRTSQSTTPTPVSARPDVKPQIVGEAQKLKNIDRSLSAGPPDVKPNISQISKYMNRLSWEREGGFGFKTFYFDKVYAMLKP